jgi:hypothetical protein
VTYMIQFRRLRRGIPEVIRTLSFDAVDGAAALASAQSLAGTRHWPVRADSLRVMDDHGRTLLDWVVPAGLPLPVAFARAPVRAMPKAR